MTTLIEQALDAADWAVTAPAKLKNVQASYIHSRVRIQYYSYYPATI